MVKTATFIIPVLFSLALATGLVSCTTASRVVDKPGLVKSFNVAYGEHKKQKMDVFVPAEPIKKDTVLVMVHGGAWRRGDKRMLRGLQNRFAKEGFTVVNTNYRLVDKKTNISQQLSDLAKGLSVADSMLNDPHYILIGESAGAHLSLLYGYSNPADVSKIISLSGPTDFTDKGFIQNLKSPIVIPILNKLVAEKYRHGEDIHPAYLAYSPVNKVTYVPTLIIHGRFDPLVNIRQAYRLDSALASRNVPHKLVVARYGGHLARLNPLYKKSLILPAIRNFIMY